MAQRANQTCHAWVLRHGAPRPWLICIPGYEMGVPHLDLPAFRARKLHDHFGLNLAVATLPLHGPRRRNRRSGEGYLGIELVDTLRAQAQAARDLRKLLLWIRSQWDGAVGVYGLSLGGYNAALLASLEEVDTVIAGIPATDLAGLAERHGPPLEMRSAKALGLEVADARELFRAISPLSLQPRVPKAHRAIFAGSADAVVPPEQPRDLWRHWDRPRVVWYPGGHVTFRSHPEVERLVEECQSLPRALPLAWNHTLRYPSCYNPKAKTCWDPRCSPQSV